MEDHLLQLAVGIVVFLFSFAVKFLRSIARDLGAIKVSVAGAAQKIGHHEKTLDDHEGRIRALETVKTAQPCG